MTRDHSSNPVPAEVQHTWQKYENRANRETFGCYECGGWSDTADYTKVCPRKDRRGNVSGRRHYDLE